MTNLSLLQHKAGRALIAFTFYFAEGAPIGFIWWAMPALLRQSGADIGVIGTFTSLLTLPWVLKFLWAPLIDVLRTPRFGFTKWIGLSQTLMCLSLLPLIFIPLQGNILIWGTLLFIHSLCAATQDVSVDAMIINLVAPREKGMLNGYMQAGMLVGRSLFGGATLIFIQQAGLPVTIGVMILTIMSTMLLLPLIKEQGMMIIEKEQFGQFKENLFITFKSKQIWFAIAFALTAAAAFESAGAMAGPFLTDKDTEVKSIGFFFSIPVVAATLLGGLAGGFLSDKLSRKNSVTLFLFSFVTVVAVIGLTELLSSYTSPFVWMMMFTVMYLFVGMFTTSYYALFMDVTNPNLGATQFSTFMAATNGCEAWAVYAAGLIASQYGYSPAFLVMCLISVVSLFFLTRIKVRV